MLILITSIIVGLIVAWRLYDDMAWDTIDVIAGLYALFVGFFAFVGFLGIGTLVANVTLPKQEVRTEVELVAIQDGTSTSGSFFLGSGYIQSQASYTYYAKDGDSSCLKSTPAENVKVYQDDSKPRVVSRTGCTWRFDWLADCISLDTVLSIHVPKNTIKQNFVLGPKK